MDGNEREQWGIPMTPELHDGIVRMEMSKWLEFPCPYCGKPWRDVQDLIDGGAAVCGYRLAAHKVCWDIVQGGGKPERQ